MRAFGTGVGGHFLQTNHNKPHKFEIAQGTDFLFVYRFGPLIICLSTFKLAKGQAKSLNTIHDVNAPQTVEVER